MVVIKSWRFYDISDDEGCHPTLILGPGLKDKSQTHKHKCAAEMFCAMFTTKHFCSRHEGDSATVLALQFCFSLNVVQRKRLESNKHFTSWNKPNISCSLTSPPLDNLYIETFYVTSHLLEAAFNPTHKPQHELSFIKGCWTMTQILAVWQWRLQAIWVGHVGVYICVRVAEPVEILTCPSHVTSSDSLQDICFSEWWAARIWPILLYNLSIIKFILKQRNLL